MQQKAVLKCNYRAGQGSWVYQLITVAYKEDELFYVCAPALDTIAYGEDLEAARTAFSEALASYLVYTLNKGTLEADLIAHGWIRRGKKLEQPTLEQLKAKQSEFGEMMQKPSFQVLAPYPIALPQ